MSMPWQFLPNCSANVWLNQTGAVGPPMTPPDYAGIDVQLMRPQIQINHPLGVKVLHRFIVRLAQTRSFDSGDVANVIVLQLYDTNPNINQWYEVLDVSFFPYDDPSVGGYTCDVVMLYAQRYFP